MPPEAGVIRPAYRQEGQSITYCHLHEYSHLGRTFYAPDLALYIDYLSQGSQQPLRELFILTQTLLTKPRL